VASLSHCSVAIASQSPSLSPSPCALTAGPSATPPIGPLRMNIRRRHARIMMGHGDNSKIGAGTGGAIVNVHMCKIIWPREVAPNERWVRVGSTTRTSGECGGPVAYIEVINDVRSVRVGNGHAVAGEWVARGLRVVEITPAWHVALSCPMCKRRVGRCCLASTKKNPSEVRR